MTPLVRNISLGAGGSADAGVGGAGGNSTPTNGGNGTEWDSTHGSGGGGGASITINVTGGTGGNYGGGGGGTGRSSSAVGAAGIQGIIVVIYTPSGGGSNSCTYGGSGDWYIEYADNCYETGTIYVTGVCYFDYNGAGSFGLAGTIACTKIRGGAGFQIRGLNGTALLQFHN